MIRILETQRVFTPLGIRFWDAALNRPILDGLCVQAWPEGSRRPGVSPLVAARRTASGIYAFHGLPGLAQVEYPDAEPAATPSPPEPRTFVVHVRDERRRFVSAAFLVTLPLPFPGVFLSDAVGSPPGRLPGFLLYPAVTRAVPASVATVSGNLVCWDVANPSQQDRPAAHAVVRVDDAAGRSSFGVADQRGAFRVVLRYPELAEPSESPHQPGRSLLDQRWPLTLTVQYEPQRILGLPGTDTPDYVSILAQRTADLYAAGVHSPTPVPHLELELTYGRDLVVRSLQSSSLLIRPFSTSP